VNEAGGGLPLTMAKAELESHLNPENESLALRRAHSNALRLSGVTLLQPQQQLLPVKRVAMENILSPLYLEMVLALKSAKR